MTCQDVVRLSDAGIFPKNLASLKRFLQRVSRARKIRYPDRSWGPIRKYWAEPTAENRSIRWARFPVENSYAVGVDPTDGGVRD